MEFLFQISTYNKEELVEQLSRALDRQMELSSRQRLPGVWRAIDGMNKRPQPTEADIRGRVIRYKVYGILFLAMGIFLLVPGLMEPQKLIIPLIAGILAVGCGICYLCPLKKSTGKHSQEASQKPWRKNANKRCQTASEKLLEGLQTLELNDNVPVHIFFSEKGMEIGEGQLIPYLSFNSFVETKELYLLTWSGKVTLLQKRDLTVGTHQDFIRFLKEKVSCYENAALL